jgi:hypothetical protein
MAGLLVGLLVMLSCSIYKLLVFLSLQEISSICLKHFVSEDWTLLVVSAVMG